MKKAFTRYEVMMKEKFMNSFARKSLSFILSFALLTTQHYANAQNYQALMSEALQSESFQLPDNLNPEFSSAVERYRELTGQIDAAYGTLTEYCDGESIPLDKLELCRETAQNVVQAQEEMQGPLLDIVNTFLPPAECPPNEANAVNAGLGDTIGDTSTVLAAQCMRDGAGKEILNCGKEVACSIASTLTLSGLWGANSESENRECLSAENDCLTQLLTSLASFLVSSIKGVWSLLKIGANWVAEKGKQFWAWVTNAEDETSENQELLQNLTDEDVEDIKQDSKGWMARMLSGITSMLGEWLRTDVFCEEWKGIPHTSECRKPLQAWGCLGCGTMISALCSLGGVATGLIVETFLAGGVFGAISKAAKGAKVGVSAGSSVAKAGITAMKSSPRYAELTKHLAGLPGAKQTVAMSQSLGKGAAQVGRASKATVGKVGNALANLSREVGKSVPVQTARNVLARLGGTAVGRGGAVVLAFENRVFQRGLNLVSGSGSRSATPIIATANMTDAQRIEGAEKLLGTKLSPEQREALLEAHYVGAGELGADGVSSARIGNYTQAQKCTKGRKLMKDGTFSREQTQKLMDAGYAGLLEGAVQAYVGYRAGQAVGGCLTDYYGGGGSSGGGGYAGGSGRTRGVMAHARDLERMAYVRDLQRMARARDLERMRSDPRWNSAWTPEDPIPPNRISRSSIERARERAVGRSERIEGHIREIQRLEAEELRSIQARQTRNTPTRQARNTLTPNTNIALGIAGGVGIGVPVVGGLWWLSASRGYFDNYFDNLYDNIYSKPKRYGDSRDEGYYPMSY